MSTQACVMHVWPVVAGVGLGVAVKLVGAAVEPSHAQTDAKEA
jgi:hypothetical protein